MVRMSKSLLWCKVLNLLDSRWLLIFDRVHEWNCVSRYLPISCKTASSVIATSQTPLERCNHRLRLVGLDPYCGSRLLLGQLTKVNALEKGTSYEQLAEEISETLGGSPFLIVQAGGQISLSKSSLEEFIAEPAFRGRKISAFQNHYEGSLATIMDRTLGKLGKSAAHLLHMLAFFDHRYIREDLLLIDRKNDCLEFLSLGNNGYVIQGNSRNDPSTDNISYHDLFNELAEIQLVKREVVEQCSFLRIDRSLQLILLLNLKHNVDDQQAAFERSLCLLRGVFLRPSYPQQESVNTYAFKRAILSHLMNSMITADQVRHQMNVSLIFAEFFVDVGADIVERGLTVETKFVLGKAEEALDRLKISLEDNNRKKMMRILEACTDNVGISTRAQGLASRQKYLSAHEEDYAKLPLQYRSIPEEIVIYNAKMSIAYSLQHFDETKSVRRICEASYSHLFHCGENYTFPRESARYFNLMAYVNLHDREPEIAVENAKKAYTLMVQAMPNEPATTRFRFCWATMLFQTGSKEAAIEEHKAILDLRIQEFTVSNTLTLQSQVQLGIMCHLVGHNRQAE